ncbi:uncharacterized protein LOC135124602 [Zophobas morio]|uniref:uncharacterized protein LOC135124602 n=1 Tax=Zophobas morio TaxID=2755281 RepID=UPI0030827CC9
MQNLYDSKNNIKEDDGEHRKSGTKVLSKTTIPKTRTNTSIKTDHSKDKELINSGLHKLVSSFNANKVGLKSSKTVTNRKNEKLPLSATSSIPDRQQHSHITLTKQVSIDKYTMTDFDENERKINFQTSVLNEQTYRDLQWTDPRLLKKYSLVQPFKKSLTIPYVNKSEFGSEIVEATSDDEAELLCAENKHFLFKCLYYICTTSVSFIGSMCGITLITVVLWKMLDENLFSFHLEAPRNDLFLRTIIRGVMSLAFQLINNVFGKIMRLLTISTSEVFAHEEELASTWYRKLF